MHFDVRPYADHLLSLNPDPIPRYVIYRELFGYEKEHPDCLAAYEAVRTCPQVERITAAQNELGFWEPFHGTTEGMIRRLLSFGLDVTHPTLAGVQDYLIGLLEGRMTTGQYEKQDHPLWYSEMFEPLIAAAMLSLITPDHPLVQKHRAVWASFAEEIFAGGHYDEAHDRAVKANYFGVSVLPASDRSRRRCSGLVGGNRPCAGAILHDGDAELILCLQRTARDSDFHRYAPPRFPRFLALGACAVDPCTLPRL